MYRSLLALSLALAAAPLSAAPAITFEENAVVVSGVTPGAKTAWFAVSNESVRYPARITRRATLMTASGSGALRLDLNDPIPTASIWVVADLETGESAVAAPAAYRVRQSTLPETALRRRASGIAPRLDLDVDEVELFYVRPNVGAWRLGAGRTIPLQSLEPVGDSPSPPDDFASGDVIVTVDPFSMIVHTLRVR